MSAGGLSYDGLTTSRKATLPSVEMWGTNMNILKNPTAGIYTRRVDKVGDTQGILLAQDDAGDRIGEYINVYARGVNPMVSVSYDNYSNNGGTSSTHASRAQGVKLPYRPEVFRPPVLRQENLMPLSRQPRNWFYALTNPELPQVIQSMECPEKRSSTLANPLRTPLPPSYHKTVEVLQEPVWTKTAVQSQCIPSQSIVSNPQDLQQPVGVPDRASLSSFHQLQKAVVEDPLHMETVAAACHPSLDTHSTRDLLVELQQVRESLLRLGHVTASTHGGEEEQNVRLHDEHRIPSHQRDRPSYEILTQKINALRQSMIEATNQNQPSKGLIMDLKTSNVQTPMTGGDERGSRAMDTTGHAKTVQFHQPLQINADTMVSGGYTLDSQDRYFDPTTSAIQPVLQYNRPSRPTASTIHLRPPDPLKDKPNWISTDPRLGSWVVGQPSRPDRGSDAVSLYRHNDHVVPMPASKNNLSSHVIPNQRMIGEVNGVLDPVSMYHSVKPTLDSISVMAPQTDTSQVRWLHPSTIDYAMTSKRPLGETTTNHQYQYQRILPHTQMGHGSVHEGLPTTSAFTAKSGYEKHTPVEKAHQPRRTVLVQDTSTQRNPRAQGHDVYDVQSRDGYAYRSGRPTVEGFIDRTGSAIPMTGQETKPSEIPVDSEWTQLKKRAYRAYHERAAF